MVRSQRPSGLESVLLSLLARVLPFQRRQTNRFVSFVQGNLITRQLFPPQVYLVPLMSDVDA